MVATPSGTIAFLFTDIVGSTRLWEEDDGAMASALEQHDVIKWSTIADHDGSRRSPKPTKNFLATIQYRELRDHVGVDDQNPLDRQSIEEIFDEARAWFRQASSA